MEEYGHAIEIRPFGPPILKFRLPPNIVNDLNEFIDNSDHDQLVEALDYSEKLVGKVTSELWIPPRLLAREATWGFFSAAVNAFVEAYDQRYDSIHMNGNGERYFDKEKGQHLEAELQSAWFVRSLAGDYNPVHLHPDIHLSSVGYLKLPDWEEEMAMDAADHSGRTNGCLQFQHGSANFFVRNTYTVVPEVGDFYIFPAWLPHCAYPFRSAGERRSFSINFLLALMQNEENEPEDD